MLPIERFTEQAQGTLMRAQGLARAHEALDVEHLLLALLEPNGLVPQALVKLGIDPAPLQAALNEQLQRRPRASSQPSQGQMVTARVGRALERAIASADARGDRFVGVEHLFLALLEEREHPVIRQLLVAGIRPDRIASVFDELRAGRPVDNPNAEGNYGALQKYTRDLTALAREDKIDPVIGREDEIVQVMEVLARRTKNNPVLIGEPGVGKTAIVEGLARKIVADEVPGLLRGKRVLALDLGAMVAGSKFRGEFEERIKSVLAEIQKSEGQIVLFIDELHTLVGAGNGEGAMDAANLLKPALARGELRAIGATTLDEYRERIEKDPALERRFHPIYVDEPSSDETIEILRQLKERYEKHHALEILDSAILAAVKLSDRYIQGRHQPDKSIDLMDHASAKVRLRAQKERESSVVGQIARLQQQEDLAWEARDYETAAKARQERLKIEEEHPEVTTTQSSQKVVTPEDMAAVVAAWTGIPVKSLYSEESVKLLDMEGALHRRVVGQDDAIVAISDAIRRSRSGLSDPRRPIGSFLFLGPTGVGKTELAKTLAEFLFDDEDALLRIDMSEYMEPHSVARLIGSPPGYVGHDEGGQLTEAVRRRPYQVILFDEIEKAHPDVWNALLQILEDGRLTDGQGRTVDFKNTIAIMTSNAGVQAVKQRGSLGYRVPNASDAEDRDAKERYLQAIKQIFRPEWLNRIDEIVVFSRLTREQLREVVDRMVGGLRERLEAKGIQLTLTDGSKDYLVEHGYDEVFGARPLRRLIQREIENPLAKRLLTGEYTAGDKLEVVLVDGRLAFDVSERRMLVDHARPIAA